MELKLFLSKTKKDLVGELTAEFSQDMEKFTRQIYNDMDSFRILKSRIEGLHQDVEGLKHAISKLVEISQSLDTADFDLTAFSSHIKEAEKEKLVLEQKVDALEKLIAKQRREH